MAAHGQGITLNYLGQSLAGGFTLITLIVQRNWEGLTIKI